MIEIQKDPNDVKKRFKCDKCDCEFTAEYKDTEDWGWIIDVRCPVCKARIDWTAGEDENLIKPEPMSQN